MGVNIQANCVQAKAVVSRCIRVIQLAFWRIASVALAIAPIGSSLKHKAYVAVAMSLSPPK